jgi:hypothetical protein
MSDLNTIRMIARRKNIARYRRLLGTQLTADERCYIERRIAQERAELEALKARRSTGPKDRAPVEAVIAASAMARGGGDRPAS